MIVSASPREAPHPQMVCWGGMESLAFMYLVWSEAGVVGNSTPDS